MLREWRAIDNVSGRHGYTISINKGVEPVGGGTAHGPEEIIEASVDWCIGNGSAVIDPFHCGQAVLVDGFTRLVEKRHADMPFAEHRRRVTFAAQQGGQRQARFFNHARPAHAGEHPAHPRTKRHPSREQAVTRGRAHRRRTVRVGEPHPLLGQAIQIRCGHFGFRVVATDVAVTQIIGQNHDDVRSASSFCCQREAGREEHRDTDGPCD